MEILKQRLDIYCLLFPSVKLVNINLANHHRTYPVVKL